MNGSPAGANSFYLLPPTDPGDFVKALFPEETLDVRADFFLRAKVGIRQAAGSTSQGVTVQVVAAATQDVPEEPAWTVLQSLTLAKDETRTIEVPLGLWPLRPQA